MKEKNWDPLDASLSSEIIIATAKRQIKNILKSYTGWFDPLSELVQNALDAVDNRRKAEKKYKPHIWITINLKDNIISVTDNGIGFSEDEFRSFLAPNISFKRSGNRGNKGVGATYLAYGFNFLQVGTKTPDFSFMGAIEGGREWVEDDSGTKGRPLIRASKLIDHSFDKVDRGSTFSLRLVGDFIRPKDLLWIGANNANQWEVILKLKTPLGGIYFTKGYDFPGCTLSVVDRAGKKTEKTLNDCEYIYPHKVIATCLKLNDIRKIQQDLIKKGKDGSKLPDRCCKLNGIFEFWTWKDIVSDSQEFGGLLDPKEKELVKKYNLNCYGFFCYSTEIWDKFNDNVVRLREGGRILRGGLQLATNFMPQGEALIIPLTKNIGYQNVTHVVVHFDNADPDLGRKGFQPELEILAQTISARIVKIFLNWKRVLKKDTGVPPNIIEEKNIHDWIKEQEDHERKNPLIIRREDVFLPIKHPSLSSEPLNEQDVVALFNQLLAGGVIRGIKLMSTSQHEQYDGILRFCMKRPYENHIFDIKKNPLGVEKSRASDEFESAPGILEYKYSFDALLEDIEKGEKNERQINLVVAWEMGKHWESRYEITPLLHFDNLHHRYFHGGTHIIKNSATGDVVFPAIILSELIGYINDPKAAQKYQKETYMQ